MHMNTVQPAKEVVIRIPSYKSTITSVSEFKEQPYHGFCYPLSDGQRVQMASPVLIRRSPPSDTRLVQSPQFNMNTTPGKRMSPVTYSRQSSDGKSPDSGKPIYVTSPQTSRRSPMLVGDPIKIVVPSTNAVQTPSPPNVRKFQTFQQSESLETQSETDQFDLQRPEFNLRVVGPQGTYSVGQKKPEFTRKLVPSPHQPLTQKLSPIAGVDSINAASQRRAPSLQHRVTPIAKPDCHTETRINQMIEDGRRTSTRRHGNNSALNSFLHPTGSNERVSKRISPPKLDRSTAKNIITAHINQMIGYPEQGDLQANTSNETYEHSPKSPTFYKKGHGQTHSWLAQAAENLQHFEKSQKQSRYNFGSNEHFSTSDDPCRSPLRESVSAPAAAAHQQEPSERAVKMRTSVYIPNMTGGLTANHASDRAKRRRSLTKLSMNELGVEDNRPWAQTPPKSPNPPRSPTAEHRNVDPFQTTPLQSDCAKNLECLDRSSFRALMDDLDNITLQAHVQIDKFKLVDPRQRKDPTPITITIPTTPIKNNLSPPIITVNKPVEQTPLIENTSSSSSVEVPNPVSPTTPQPKIVKDINNQTVQIASAPKIIKSSVGKNLPQTPGEQRDAQRTGVQLNAIKNQMKLNVEHSPPQNIEPDPTWPNETDVDLNSKKVDFSAGLGIIEGTNQTVKDWSDTPERKTANIMADIRKKISKKQSKDIDERIAIVEQKDIQPIKRESQKERDNREQEKSRRVHDELNNLIQVQEQTPAVALVQKPSIAAKQTIDRARPLPKADTKADKKADTQTDKIEKFYYPFGKPRPQCETEAYITAIDEFAKENKKQSVKLEDMGDIVREMKLPFYWKEPLFRACGGTKGGSISIFSLGSTWKKICSTRFDPESQLIALLTNAKRNYVTHADLAPLIMDVVETHPGLEFLRSAPEFHTRYVTTVTARLFYCVSAWDSKLNLPKLRHSDFAQVLDSLDSLEDINNEQKFFSYEHFYVIYCRFWELDSDHDLKIGPTDLAKYGDYSISVKAVDRIMSGTVTSLKKTMQYNEFVWFILSEEDKGTLTAAEYWFRVMDRDGDGYITLEDLEFFYKEQETRLRGLGVEPLPFRDLLCLMIDLVGPAIKHYVSLWDLKSCKLQHIFFDTFLNAEKYLDREQREPFDGNQEWDWARWASEEYSLLVADEEN